MSQCARGASSIGERFLPCCGLICANDHCINLYFILIKLLEFNKDISPAVGFRSAVKALEDRIPITEAIGQITPRRTGFQDPENSIDEQRIALCSGSEIRGFS